MTNAEAWFNIALRPRKPEGSLGRTAQDGHLDSHTAPELWRAWWGEDMYLYLTLHCHNQLFLVFLPSPCVTQFSVDVKQHVYLLPHPERFLH